jgi:hypothetical protein
MYNPRWLWPSIGVFFLGSFAHAAEWGNLTGRFVYDGAAPTPEKLQTTRDKDCCATPRHFEILQSPERTCMV